MKVITAIVCIGLIACSGKDVSEHQCICEEKTDAEVSIPLQDGGTYETIAYDSSVDSSFDVQESSTEKDAGPDVFDAAEDVDSSKVDASEDSSADCSWQCPGDYAPDSGHCLWLCVN
jgi:hypothetical protein